MHAPECGVVHAERGEFLAPEVGQEHVAPPDQRVRHLAPLGAPEIEGHAALATVVELEGGVHVGLVRHQPRGREAAQGIPLRRLDLHHARAPVGEHGGGRGHGDPDAELEHAHAVEGSRHGGRPCHGRAPFCKPAGPCYTARMAEQAQVLGPTSHYFYSQRLKLHYVDWGNAERRPLLLLHGGRDHCRSWDWVAADLRRDFHLIAPDLRGHGDSAWAVGSTYSMIDYVLDLAALLKTLDLFPITIIGHSLGARVALQYAGIYPDRVARLVAIEGLGPPAGLTKPPSAAARMLQWLREMQALARRHPKPYATLEEAITRMREANPHLTDEQARHLTVSGVIRHEDGTYAWKFDNFVRAVSPYLFNVDEAREIWSHVTCPVLLVRGSESWAPDPEAEGHAAAFRQPHIMTVERAGHWVHHDQLAAFLRGVRGFLQTP